MNHVERGRQREGERKNEKEREADRRSSAKPESFHVLCGFTAVACVTFNRHEGGQGWGRLKAVYSYFTLGQLRVCSENIDKLNGSCQLQRLSLPTQPADPFCLSLFQPIQFQFQEQRARRVLRQGDLSLSLPVTLI